MGRCQAANGVGIASLPCDAGPQARWRRSAHLPRWDEPINTLLSSRLHRKRADAKVAIAVRLAPTRSDADMPDERQQDWRHTVCIFRPRLRHSVPRQHPKARGTASTPGSSPVSTAVRPSPLHRRRQLLRSRGAPDITTAIRIVHAAIAAGINFLDNSGGDAGLAPALRGRRGRPRRAIQIHGEVRRRARPAPASLPLAGGVAPLKSRGETCRPCPR